MEHWLTSLRHALRRLRRQPVFASIVVMTLALGIGLNTALVSVFRAVLLDELPWQDSQRLVMIWNHTEGRDELGLSEPEIFDYRRRSEAFDEIGAYRSGGANLTVEGRALGLWVAHVSPNLFTTLKTRPPTPCPPTIAGWVRRSSGFPSR